jgi:guanylate kinase
MKHITFLVGESGCGKTYLQNALIDLYPEKYCQIISTTSRTPREGEVEGKHYHFVKDYEFDDGVIANKFVQFVNFGGNHYGTTLAEYERKQKVGLFVCTPEGVMDTVNGIRENSKLHFTYSIVYFFTTNQLLEDHKTPKDRIERGDIREQFTKMYSANIFKNIPIKIIQDKDIHNLLYTTIDAEL